MHWLDVAGSRWLAGMLLALLACRPAAAQFGDDALPSAEERNKEFQAIAQEVAHLEREGNILKRVAKLVSPTVVHIEAEKTETSGALARRRSVEEAGSGVIIEMGGKFYVLTNRHVVKLATMNKINIRLADGRQVTPTVVWGDPGTDIAVLGISAKNLVAARLGDSDQVEIGDFVLAVGSPFGLSHSVTYGIISAKGRRDLELGDEGVPFQDFMQTDAAINPGNSGGPLVNLRGEVIGLNTAIASSSGGSEGIGFTIPINMVMIVSKQLIEHGSVVRAYLGVSLDSKFGPTMATKLGLSRPIGARISGITARSPAEQARLQVDDIVLEFNGVRIENDSHLISLVSLTEVDKEIPLLIFRDRQTYKVSVKVGDRSKFEP